VVLLSGEVSYELVDADGFPWQRHPSSQHFTVYNERLRDGGEALIGRVGEEIVFTAWVVKHRLRIDEIAWTWTLAEPDAVAYDVITEPAWRGRGIYPEALRLLSGLLAETGTRYLWIYAEEENTASIRGIVKAQFEYRGCIEARRLMGAVMRSGRVEGVNA
jgi:RimJ/RimL family protein N-acetyltransferase